MANLKISQYPNEAVVLATGDLFDVSKLISTGPDVYESQKLNYSTLLSEIKDDMVTGGTVDFFPIFGAANTLADSVVKQQSTTEIRFGQSGTDMTIGTGFANGQLKWNVSGNAHTIRLNAETAAPNNVYMALASDLVAGAKQIYMTVNGGTSSISFEKSPTSADIDIDNGGATGTFQLQWQNIFIGNTATAAFQIQNNTIGINVAPSATTQLYVVGSGANNPVKFEGAATTNAFVMNSSGFIGINATPGSYRLTINGSIEILGAQSIETTGALTLHSTAFFKFKGDSTDGDIFGDGSSNLRICSNSSGAAGGSLILKAFEGGSSFREAIKITNTASGTQPNVYLVSDRTISISSSGANVGIGNVSAFGSQAINVLGIANGQPPISAVAGLTQIFSKNSSDTAATLGLYLEQAVEASATFVQTHRLKVWINGTEYYLSLDAV